MLEIVYQDRWLVAVNKPSGWLVHRSWLDRDEKVVVMQTVRDQIGQHVFTAHRLDRPTSGVLLNSAPPPPLTCTSMKPGNNQPPPRSTCSAA